MLGGLMAARIAIAPGTALATAIAPEAVAVIPCGLLA
jgi:hypothetical protein